MPEADSSDLKTCGSQVTIFTLKTLQVMRSMEQFLLCGRAPNGFLNQLLVEAPPWEFLLNNCLKTRASCDRVYGTWRQPDREACPYANLLRSYSGFQMSDVESVPRAVASGAC